MSQHIFYRRVGELDFQVKIGWDKPDQNYYFVISEVDQHGDAVGAPIASNRYLPGPSSVTLESIKAVCEDYGITLPLGLLNEVHKDQKADNMNRRVVYETYTRPNRGDV